VARAGQNRERGAADREKQTDATLEARWEMMDSRTDGVKGVAPTSLVSPTLFIAQVCRHEIGACTLEGGRKMEGRRKDINEGTRVGVEKKKKDIEEGRSVGVGKKEERRTRKKGTYTLLHEAVHSCVGRFPGEGKRGGYNRRNNGRE
jgi:hypothetical protein